MPGVKNVPAKARATAELKERQAPADVSAARGIAGPFGAGVR